MLSHNNRNDGTHGFALSVDVEDYYQVWAFSRVIARRSWDGFAPRVEIATLRALEMFDERSIKATFFTLGWVAERFPALVREIVSRGHELASHGYDHTKAFQQSPAEFRQDIVKTKSLLEDVAGVEVIGYRAPGFSIGAKTPWAHQTLAEAGYRYSSSAHPIAHDHYGDPNGSRTPFQPIAGAAFIEAPVATAELLGRRISCAGGGWFRAAPYGLSKHMISRARATLDGPIIFYFHPWEIDPEQPRIRTAPMKSRMRHYFNLSSMKRKLERLLSDFRWGRVDEVLSLREMGSAV